MKLVSLPLAVLCLAGLAASFQEKAAAPASAPDPVKEAALIAEQLPTYPLTTCPVSHDSLEAMGKPMDLLHEGRLVRLCCKSCVKEFKKDPATTAAILKSIEEGVIQAQRASYPLKTCAVSGEELGSMGEPLELVHGTRLVRLCCKGCIKGFQRDPAATLAKIDAALIAEQRKTYPLTTCLVGGETIEGAGFEKLYGVRLTRFCGEKCAAGFAKEPAKYLAMLDKAAAEKAKKN
jgi:YHS domain-containing protein